MRVIRRPAFSREKKSIDSRWKWLNTLHPQVVEQALAHPAGPRDPDAAGDGADARR